MDMMSELRSVEKRTWNAVRQRERIVSGYSVLSAQRGKATEVPYRGERKFGVWRLRHLTAPARNSQKDCENRGKNPPEVEEDMRQKDAAHLWILATC
jgi:hypothetical protein